jgi:hypothetical protein
MPSYSKKKKDPEFEEAGKYYDEMIDELRSRQRGTQELWEIEKYVTTAGRELMRRMIQGYVDGLSAQEERRDDVVGTDGGARPYARERSRKVTTTVGQILLNRLGYSHHGTGSVFPLDLQLNLPVVSYSHCLLELVGEQVVADSYDETVKHIDRHTAGDIPKRQAEEAVRDLARDFGPFYQQRLSISPLLQQEEEILVITFDCKGIVMRIEDLREETRKRAEQSQHKLSTRLSPGEKPNRKRMAVVTAVYTIAPFLRTPEDIMDAKPEERLEPPRPSNKRVWASIESTMSAVLDEAFHEAKRLDPDGRLRWVVLVDGLEEQIRQAEAAAKRHNAEVTVIQDIYHVMEYLWQAALSLHGGGNAEAEAWYIEHVKEILRGKASDVAAGMRRSATRRGLTQSERKPVDKCASYLQNSAERLRYGEALAQGHPIGTGVVEGACRHLVKRRMEVSGARWSLDGAEAVLRLRALWMCGDWDEYLTYHRQCELRRNYPEVNPRRLAA